MLQLKSSVLSTLFIMNKFNLFLNIALMIACSVHVSNILRDSMFPELPNVKHYENDLNNIEFPITFKFCFMASDTNRERRNWIFKKFGYNSIVQFFRGQSMFDKSLVGWSGHTENGTTMTSTEGKKLEF